MYQSDRISENDTRPAGRPEVSAEVRLLIWRLKAENPGWGAPRIHDELLQLGVEVATKYGENPLVVNCIAAHHDDVPHESEVSVLVQAADAISGSRPGARREAFETYV